MATKATKAASGAVSGFGVDKSAADRKFDHTKWSYRKQTLLSVIVDKIPAARADLGMATGQKLNWQYGGWSPAMIAKAHEILDKYAKQLPPRQNSGKF